jgi:Ca-activated chloride channel family protein
MGNYKDSKIEVLARMGNGNFAYLDSDEEAEKALVLQLGESSITVAKDVTIQFGFEPQTVKEYRLVGYENRIEALQVIPQQLIGTEVSSGQCIIGMAEIIPQDSTSLNTGAAGFFELQYKWPDKDSTQRQVQEFNSQVISLAQADTTVKMAVTLAWLARELKSNKQTGQFNFEPIEKLARDCGSASNGEVSSLNALLANIHKMYEPVTDNKKGRRQKQKNRDNN